MLLLNIRRPQTRSLDGLYKTKKEKLGELESEWYGVSWQFDHWIEKQREASQKPGAQLRHQINMGNLEIWKLEIGISLIFNSTTIPHGWLDRQPINHYLCHEKENLASRSHTLSPHISYLFLTCAWRARFNPPPAWPTRIESAFKTRKKTLWCFPYIIGLVR